MRNVEEAPEVRLSLCFNQLANVQRRLMAIILGTKRREMAHHPSMFALNVEEAHGVQRSLCFNQRENARRRQTAIILGIKNLKTLYIYNID